MMENNAPFKVFDKKILGNKFPDEKAHNNSILALEEFVMLPEWKPEIYDNDKWKKFDWKLPNKHFGKRTKG